MPLSDAERARLLLDSWWSHDGQWFLKVRASLGLEAAMELNESSIESIGRIEMRSLHSALGSPTVESAADLMPLVVEAHDLVGIPAEGRMDGPDAFLVHVEQCRVWEMTLAAGLEGSAPGCRGSLRRRLGWATVFFPAARVEWTRVLGRPDGDQRCAYRFRLLEEDPLTGR